MPKVKKIQINNIPTTKGISITLPVTLIDKLNELALASQGSNISRAVRFILEDYFAVLGDGTAFPAFNDQETLVPVDFYAKVMNVGKITIKNRVKKGELEVVTMFNTDFVRCSKDDIINHYSQVQMLKEEVAILKDKVKEIEKNYTVVNDLIRTVNELAIAQNLEK